MSRCEPQGWSVSVEVDAETVLTISNQHLAGVHDIDRHADTIRTAAKHLLAFIGPEPAAGGKPQPIDFTAANMHAPHHPGTCRGPDVCPHDWEAPGALPAPCRVCGGRDPLPF